MPGNPPCRAVAITDCINSAHWILGLSSGHLGLVPGWWLLKQHCVLLETKSLYRGRARKKQVAPLCISSRIPALTLHFNYAVSSLCLLHSIGIAQELFTPSDPEPRNPICEEAEEMVQAHGKMEKHWSNWDDTFTRSNRACLGKSMAHACWSYPCSGHCSVQVSDEFQNLHPLHCCLSKIVPWIGA